MRFHLPLLLACALPAPALCNPASAAALTLADMAAGHDAPAQTEPMAGARSPSARAVVRAGESVDIAAALSQRLTYAPYKPGRYVERGAVIARFDCARMQADLKAREQALKTLALRHASEVELESFGATGALDVAVAASERDQAQAEAEALRVALRECEIIAPFAAHVAERHVSAHETPQVGQPIYTLIRAGDVEISVIVPAALGARLSVRDSFALYLDGADEPVSARITRLAPDIDPVSQTREIYAKPSTRAGLKPGMSGRAVFADAP